MTAVGFRTTLCIALLAAAGCHLSSTAETSSAAGPTRRVKVDQPGLPLLELTEQELDRFKQGDALFEATIRASDGLGPLYIRDACAACHVGDGRGPGLVSKAALIGEHERDRDLASKLLPFGETQRPYTTAGAKIPLLAPSVPELRVTPRLPPAVFGRGYLEAISDADIERLALLAQGRSGSARGKLNRLKNGGIGRFGVKARLANLHDFTAEALNGDMGVTSPSRPEEPAGPEGLRDDDKPGLDFTNEQVDLIRDYVRGLQIPDRPQPTAGARALFDTARCGECHVPSYRTSPGYEVKALASVTADVYTDLLLHDMGAGLSDGVTEESAGPREFRTAPLIGLRFLPSFLHDGRAKSVEQAILAHGDGDSEGRDSVAAFKALPLTDQQQLLSFVEAL